MAPKLPPILARMERLGFDVFTSGEYNLNLFGIRDARHADTYNDLIGCAYIADGTWRVEWWPATTDPGARYLKEPMKGTSGAASLVPGQYRGVWTIGPHGQSGYEALIQRGGTVRVFRDSNRDTIHDHAEESIQDGWFGINIHAPQLDPYDRIVDYSERTVGGWSAGCQVHATTLGFRRMMWLCYKQVEHGNGDRFSYTLMRRVSGRGHV